MARPECAFDAPLQVLPWGRNVYTVLVVPEALAAAARADGTRRVEGTIEDVPVNLGLNRADVTPDTFLYVGAALQRRLGLAAGDVARCRLLPADPDAVPLPEDVAHALEAAGRTRAFDQLRPTERRRLLAPVEAAGREATRTRRIDALVRGLAPG